MDMSMVVVRGTRLPAAVPPHWRLQLAPVHVVRFSEYGLIDLWILTPFNVN